MSFIRSRVVPMAARRALIVPEGIDAILPLVSMRIPRLIGVSES
jgi:hypothetical protein